MKNIFVKSFLLVLDSYKHNHLECYKRPVTQIFWFNFWYGYQYFKIVYINVDLQNMISKQTPIESCTYGKVHKKTFWSSYRNMLIYNTHVIWTTKINETYANSVFLMIYFDKYPFHLNKLEY